MILEYLQSRDLTREERDYFWEIGISMDDWDCMFVIPDCPLPCGMKHDNSICPDNTYLGNVLSCYDLWHTEWYRDVQFRDRLCCIGIKYH